jgi:class 3 adenylate cyclase
MSATSLSGILTFLFTDLESSTLLWDRYPDLMQEVSARHDDLLRRAFEANHGRVVKTTGDGFHVVFESPVDGIAAALAAQEAIAAEEWSPEIGALKVRMGLHSGESKARNSDFYGTELNRAARVMGIAHGGQVLISGAAAGLLRGRLPDGAALIDLGLQRLKGLSDPERVYQLTHPRLETDFPPLQSSLSNPHNLPTQLTSFIGRAMELQEVKRLLESNRLLTLLGPGGTGKTRLMLQAASDLVEQFPDGVWLVELAPHTSPELVVEKTAEVLGVRGQPDRPAGRFACRIFAPQRNPTTARQRRASHPRISRTRRTSAGGLPAGEDPGHQPGGALHRRGGDFSGSFHVPSSCGCGEGG